MALFGGGAARSTSFSFGAGTANANTPASGQQPSSSLFSFGNNAGASGSQGQAQQAQSQQQGSSGLFGQPQQQQQGASNTPSLFGGGVAASGSSLFGQSKPAGQSLFGQNNTTQQQGSSSLFGSNNNQQQQKPFSFGAPQPANTQSHQQQPTFGFGQQQQHAGGSGLLGQSQFGSTLGVQAPQQQQQQQQQQNGLQSNAFTSSTLGAGSNSSSPFARQAFHQKERFNDLPEDAKKLFAELEIFINGQLRIKDELASRDYGSDIRKRAAEWNDLHGALGNTHVVLQQDAELIKGVVEKVQQDRTDYITMLEIAQSYKDNKSDGKQWLSWPGDFFAKAAAEYRERIVRYRSTIDAIEKQLSTIDSNNEHNPQLIADAIQSQHAVFMALASQVAGMHTEVDQLRRDYTQWYQQQYRSVQDPFAMSQLTSTL